MANFTYNDELYHHGILGMKWGVRRFQNKDGSLTSAGKKRYGKNLTEKPKKDVKGNLETVDAAVLRRMVNDPWNSGVGKKDPIRTRNAAILAIKGANNLGFTNGNPYNKPDQDWIMYEDQTIGFGTVADYVNRGYSPKKIKELINLSNDDDRFRGEKTNMVYTSPYFEFREGNRESLEQLATECHKIYKEDKMNVAKYGDRYDLPFLESIQNTEFEYNNDKETRDKEYSIYLDDREDYILNRSRTLKTV